MQNRKSQIKKDLEKKYFRNPKIILGIGLLSAIIFPNYAYYWKRTTMKKMEDGVRKDLERIEAKGKHLSDIPRIYDRKPSEDED